MTVRTPIYKEQMGKIGFLPDWTKGDSWFVFNKKCWIDPDYQPEPIKRRYSEDYEYDFWNHELGMLEICHEVSSHISFKKGKYIRWESEAELGTEYYQISGTPNIFAEFASIGKDVKPNEEKVRKFIDKYGMLRSRLDHIDDHCGEFTFLFGRFYPYQTFCDYAHEAYYALRLYESLIKKDYKTLRKTIIRGFDYHCLDGMHQELFCIGILDMANISESIKTKYFNEGEGDQSRLKILGEWTSWLYSYSDNEEEIDEMWRNVWVDVINEASPEFIMELAAEAISFIVYNRFMDHTMSCGVRAVSPKENGLDIYTFKDSWGGRDLLSKMWFVFYLRITGKLEQEYRTCLACGLPIIPKPGKKLRKNIKYCPTCRQVAYNHRRREAKKLWEEGTSLDKIAEILATQKPTLQRWITKWSEESKSR